eukprot:284814577_2
MPIKQESILVFFVATAGPFLWQKLLLVVQPKMSKDSYPPQLPNPPSPKAYPRAWQKFYGVVSLAAALEHQSKLFNPHSFTPANRLKQRYFILGRGFVDAQSTGAVGNMVFTGQLHSSLAWIESKEGTGSANCRPRGRNSDGGRNLPVEANHTCVLKPTSGNDLSPNHIILSISTRSCHQHLANGECGRAPVLLPERSEMRKRLCARNVSYSTGKKSHHRMRLPLGGCSRPETKLPLFFSSVNCSI